MTKWKIIVELNPGSGQWRYTAKVSIAEELREFHADSLKSVLRKVAEAIEASQ